MSSETYLKASVTFLNPTLDGANLGEVARSYRPLLRVEGDQLTSCSFEKIGDGASAMKLHTPYAVLISLHLRRQIEEFFDKSIREISQQADLWKS